MTEQTIYKTENKRAEQNKHEEKRKQNTTDRMNSGKYSLNQIKKS